MRAEFRSFSEVLGPAVITRFLRAVHLAADTCTWLIAGWVFTPSLMALQIISGVSLSTILCFSSSTTTLGQARVAVLEAYVGGVFAPGVGLVCV